MRGAFLAIGVAVLVGGLLIKTLNGEQLFAAVGLGLCLVLRHWARRQETDA